MITTVYTAEDGRKFDTKAKAIQHQQKVLAHSHSQQTE